jgi:hypothetical protein
MQSLSFSSSKNLANFFALFFFSKRSASWFTDSNTVSVISCCHLNEITIFYSVNIKFHLFKYSPLTNSKWKIAVNFLILFSNFHSFRIIFIKITNITCIGSINFTFWWNEWWCIILLIYLLPVNTVEKWMIFDLKWELSLWIYLKK